MYFFGKSLKITINNMKKFALILMFSFSLAQTGTVTLITSGEGVNKTEAINSALRNALEQTYGAFVSSNTQFLNDELVIDEVSMLSSGNIQNYDIVSELKQPDGTFNVTVEATLSLGQMVSYLVNKGGKADINLQGFAAQMKMQDVQRSSEEKVFRDFLSTVKKLSKNGFFDYDILATAEPKRSIKNKNNFETELTIVVSYNQNFINVIEYIQNVIQKTQLTSSEVENYFQTQSEFYSFLFFYRTNYNDFSIVKPNKLLGKDQKRRSNLWYTIDYENYVVRGSYGKDMLDSSSSYRSLNKGTDDGHGKWKLHDSARIQLITLRSKRSLIFLRDAMGIIYNNVLEADISDGNRDWKLGSSGKYGLTLVDYVQNLSSLTYTNRGDRKASANIFSVPSLKSDGNSRYWWGQGPSRQFTKFFLDSTDRWVWVREWDDNNYLTRTRPGYDIDDIGAYKARIYYSIFKTIERNDMLGPYITSWISDKTKGTTIPSSFQSVNKFKKREEFLYPAGVLNFLFVTKDSQAFILRINHSFSQDYLFSGKMGSYTITPKGRPKIVEAQNEVVSSSDVAEVPMSDDELQSQILGFFNANPKKSTNAAGWTSFRKNKERNASGISSDRFKKIKKELNNNNWNYIIESNIYRTQKGQELWMNLGFPYVEKNSSLSKNEMRRYLKQFVYAFSSERGMVSTDAKNSDKKVTSQDKSNNSNRKQVVNDSSNNARMKPSEMTDAYLMSQMIGFFNANSKKSINAAGWESFRKNKDRKAVGISADRLVKIKKEFNNNNWNYIIESNIYRTQKGQELWMNLGFPYVEKNSSLSKNEMRRYLTEFIYEYQRNR
jgi:hypothetical protein